MVNYRRILQLDADKNVSVRDLLSSAHCSYHSYTNDTAAYRKAKFRAELGDYVEIQYTLFYYLFTELFLMVDSRAKNAFPSFIGTSLVEAQEGA